MDLSPKNNERYGPLYSQPSQPFALKNTITASIEQLNLSGIMTNTTSNYQLFNGDLDVSCQTPHTARRASNPDALLTMLSKEDFDAVKIQIH